MTQRGFNGICRFESDKSSSRNNWKNLHVPRHPNFTHLPFYANSLSYQDLYKVSKNIPLGPFLHHNWIKCLSSVERCSTDDNNIVLNQCLPPQLAPHIGAYVSPSKVIGFSTSATPVIFLRAFQFRLLSHLEPTVAYRRQSCQLSCPVLPAPYDRQRSICQL